MPYILAGETEISDTERAPSLQKIAAGRLCRELAYDALRSAIIRLELAPRQLLTERVLSERLGVSKSPIRDALMQLEQDGLVRSTPFKGFEVAPLDEPEYRDVFQFREALEPYCVGRFARYHDDAELAAIEATHREQARLSEAREPLEAYTRSRFHAILMESLRNPTFLFGSRLIQAHIQRIQHVAVAIAGQIEQTHREHDAILEAIRARDGATAAQGMREHIYSVLDYGIRANCVSIALVQTDSFEAHVGGIDEARMKKVVAQYPLRRLGRPDDVTPMVLLLASPLSGWTTGQVVSVNGGYAMV